MDAIEAIRTRRMIPRVTDERVTREEIEELLELAVRAPTHHMTEPWRFTVLAGDGLELLAQAMAEQGAADKGEAVEDHLAGARAKAARAPVVIVVSSSRTPDPKVLADEEDHAVAMAMQNLLLAAHAKGLGAMLRTGPVATHPALNRHLGLDPDESVLGLVYLGRPAADRPVTNRAPASEKTRWIGWDD